MPITSQNPSLNNLDQELAPNLNSPSEHSDIVHNSIATSVGKGSESICSMSNEYCPRVEIVRGRWSDSSSASVEMEQYLSSPEKESSHYQEMMPTTPDHTFFAVDDFAAEYDFNASDTGLESSESPQMSPPRDMSILDDVSLLDHDWEHADAVRGIMSTFYVFSHLK